MRRIYNLVSRSFGEISACMKSDGLGDMITIIIASDQGMF